MFSTEFQRFIKSCQGTLLRHNFADASETQCYLVVLDVFFIFGIFKAKIGETFIAKRILCESGVYIMFTEENSLYIIGSASFLVDSKSNFSNDQSCGN